MTKRSRIFAQTALVSIAASLLLACSEPVVTQMDTPPDTASNFDLQLNMQDFMNSVLEPVSDTLWDSAGWINDIRTGYEELYPETDEEWLAVKQKAAQLIEAGNALALPGRALDNDGWITYTKALSTAAALAYRSADAQNQEDFFQAGAQIYSVCTACHQTYNTEISRFTNTEQ